MSNTQFSPSNPTPPPFEFGSSTQPLPGSKPTAAPTPTLPGAQPQPAPGPVPFWADLSYFVMQVIMQWQTDPEGAEKRLAQIKALIK